MVLEALVAAFCGQVLTVAGLVPVGGAAGGEAAFVRVGAIRRNDSRGGSMSAFAPSALPVSGRVRGRVLVAEDEALIRLDIRSVLEQRGWEVCGEASDGREAVRLASDLRPDVTLMDVRMPGLDGVDATRLIQRERRTPLVMMTAYDRPSLVVRSILAGATSYVLKPFAEDALASAVAAVTDEPPTNDTPWAGRDRARSSPRRDEIVAAAKHLFARRGYEATPIQDVADSVGLLKGSLYHHITSKQELLFTVVASFLDATDAVRSHAEVSVESPARRLRRFVAARRALHTLDPDGSAIVARAQQTLRETEMERVVAGAVERDVQFLERVLVDGSETGAFRLLEEPSALAARTLDVIAAPSRSRSEHFGEIDREANACAAFVLAAVSGR